MFRLANIGQVYWPVTVQQPLENGGIEEATIHVGYKLLTRPQLRERQQRVLARAVKIMQDKDSSPGGILEQIESQAVIEDGDADLLREHITGWMGIADMDGKAEAYSIDKLNALLAYEPLFKALLVGLMEASRMAPAKNLQPGPAGTPAQVQV